MRYIKICFIQVMLGFVVFALPWNLYAFNNEPNSFRGIEWSTHISKLANMERIEVEVEENDGLVLYERNNDKMSIGNAGLNRIFYGFYKKRFYFVYIPFRSASSFNGVKSALFQLYGEGYRPNSYMDKYYWFGSSVNVSLKYSDISEEGHLAYYYTPIAEEMAQDMKKAASSGASDL